MAEKNQKTGILLINLGTPDSPEPREVGKYLREFLMDPLVVDIPFPLRWILVNALIVPKRSQASSDLYKKIWDKNTGSPLLSHTLKLSEGLAERLAEKCFVVPAMRYGSPSISEAIDLLGAAKVDRILAIPLYPQYSLAATESSIREVGAQLAKKKIKLTVDFLPAFYRSDSYLDAVVEVSAPHLKAKPHDKVLFSFHGLPERQVRKTDPSSQHCLTGKSCCESPVDFNRNCYRHQCYETARLLADRLKIGRDKYEVCFQSRLGRTPWIRPYTDHLYEELPNRGVKKLAVLCPSFVADCLETLEEVQLRGKDQFLRAGGEDLFLVPSLNSSEVWVKALERMIGEQWGEF